MIELRLWIIRQTDMAYLFSRTPQDRDPTNPGSWVPRSHCQRITKMAEVPGQWRECLVTLPDWVAEQKGLL